MSGNDNVIGSKNQNNDKKYSSTSMSTSGQWFFFDPLLVCCSASTSFAFDEEGHDRKQQQQQQQQQEQRTSREARKDNNGEVIAMAENNMTNGWNGPNSTNSKKQKDYFEFLSNHVSYFYDKTKSSIKQNMFNISTLPTAEAMPISSLHELPKTQNGEKQSHGNQNNGIKVTLTTATAVAWLSSDPDDADTGRGKKSAKAGNQKRHPHHDDSYNGQVDKKVPENQRKLGGAGVVAPITSTSNHLLLQSTMQMPQHLRPAWISIRYCISSTASSTSDGGPVLPWNIQLRDIVPRKTNGNGNDDNGTDGSMEIASLRVDSLVDSVWRDHNNDDDNDENHIESGLYNPPIQVGDQLRKVDNVKFVERWNVQQFQNYIKVKFQQEKNRMSKQQQNDKASTSSSSSATWLNLEFYNPKGNPDIKHAYIVYNDERELDSNNVNVNSNNKSERRNDTTEKKTDDKNYGDYDDDKNNSMWDNSSGGRFFSVKDWMVGMTLNKQKEVKKTLRTTKTLEEIESSLGLSIPSHYYKNSKGTKHTKTREGTIGKQGDGQTSSTTATLKRIGNIDPAGWLGDSSVIQAGDYLHSIHHLESQQKQQQQQPKERKHVIRVTVANGSNTIYLTSLRHIEGHGENDSFVRLQENDESHQQQPSPSRRRRRFHRQEEERQQGRTISTSTTSASTTSSAANTRLATRDAVIATATTTENVVAVGGASSSSQALPLSFLSPFSSSRSLTPPPPPTAGGYPTTMLTATASDNGSYSNGDNYYNHPTTRLPKPTLVSISFIKPTRDTTLGMALVQQQRRLSSSSSFQESLLIVKRIDPDGFLARATLSSNNTDNNATASDTNGNAQSHGFKPGCRLISINRQSCSNWTSGQASGYLKSLVGRITLIGEYVDDDTDEHTAEWGNAKKTATMESVIQKRLPSHTIGVSFRRVDGTLTISSISTEPKKKTRHGSADDGDDENGALLGLHGILQPGHVVLAVNGIPTFDSSAVATSSSRDDDPVSILHSTMSAKQACQIIASKSTITLLTQPRSGHYHHAIVTAHLRVR